MEPTTKFPTPPQEAITYLKANPDSVADFDAVFGPGTAAKALGRSDSPAEVQPQPTPPASPNESVGSPESPRSTPQESPAGTSSSGSLLDDLRVNHEGRAAITNDLKDGTKAVVHGAIEAINETLHAAGDLTRATAKIPGSPSWVASKVGGVDLDQPVPEVPNVSKPETRAGGVVDGIAQFTAGMIGAGKFLKALEVGEGAVGLGKALLNAGKASAVSAVAFDPHQQRLSNLVERYPYLSNSVTDFLASKPDDTDAEGRFKNALEGLGLGGIAEGFAGGLKLLRALHGGDAEGATQAADTLVPQTETVPQADTAPQVQPAPQANTEPQPRTPEFPGDMTTGQDVVAADQQAGSKVPPPMPNAKQEELPLEGGGPAKDSAGVHVQENPKGTEQATHSTVRDGYQPKVELTPEAVSQVRQLVTREDLRPDGIDLNMDHIQNVEDVKGLANSISIVLRDELQKVRGGDPESGVRDWDTVRRNAGRLADLAGDDPDLMLQRMGSQSQNLLHLDSEITAYRAILSTLGKRAGDLVRSLDQPLPGPMADRARNADELNRTLSLFADTQGLVKGIGSNIARSLNAMKLDVGPDARMLAKFDVKEFLKDGQQGTDLLARRLSAIIDDPETLGRMEQHPDWVRAIQVHNEWWLNSMLSSPKTHIANLSSNAVAALYLPAEDIVGGLLPWDKARVLEGAYRYAGLRFAIGDSLRMAAKSFKAGDSLLDPHVSKLGNNTMEIITADNLLPDGAPDPLRTLVDGLGTAIRLPGRFLLTGDEFFKQLTYRAKVYADAMAAARTSGITDQEQLGRFVQNAFSRAFDPVTGKGVDEEALGKAREATFTQPLDYGFGRWLQAQAEEHPVARLITLFVQTPINITRFVWRRTPGINVLSERFREELRGDHGVQSQRTARSQMAMGSLLWAGAAALAAEGKITGQGSADPEVRQLKIKGGWLPYAVKVGDRYIQFNRLDPFGMFLGLAGDFSEIAGKADKQTFGDLATAATVAVAKNVTSKTYLQNVTNTVDALSQPDRHVERFMENQAASYIPSVLASYTGDPYLREVRSVMDSVMRRIPGLSEALDPVRNALGQKVEVPKGFAFGEVSPFAQVNWKGGDKVAAELARQLEISNKGINKPQPVQDGVDLTQLHQKDGHTLYDRYLEIMSDPGHGLPPLQDALEHLITSPAYRNQLTDGDVLNEGSRAGAIRMVLEQYREVAKGMLMQESPEFLARAREANMRKVQTMRFGAPAN